MRRERVEHAIRVRDAMVRDRAVEDDRGHVGARERRCELFVGHRVEPVHTLRDAESLGLVLERALVVRWLGGTDEGEIGGRCKTREALDE